MMNRREFVTMAAGVCAGCLCGARALRAAEGLLDAGEVAKYAKDGIYADFAENGVLIVRRKNRLYAVSSLCSHKGQAVAADPDKEGQLKCDKHGSLFSPEGEVLKGPAKTPLLHHGISIDDKKRVQVDLAAFYEKEEWAKTGSFVELPEAP